MNANTLLLTILLSLITVGAQLLMKKGLAGIDTNISDFNQLMSFVWAGITNYIVLISLALQALGFVLWMYLVSNAKLALVSTVSGAAFYIIISIASYFIFGENLTTIQWLGIIVVTIGVLMIVLKV
jgi:drug/metabolite transporter (DMT)-like permease